MDDTTGNLIATELGRMILNYALPPDWAMLAQRVDSAAVRIVAAIREALEDERLDDFCCLDQIVEIINASGVGTSRHDFG